MPFLRCWQLTQFRDAVFVIFCPTLAGCIAQLGDKSQYRYSQFTATLFQSQLKGLKCEGVAAVYEYRECLGDAAARGEEGWDVVHTVRVGGKTSMFVVVPAVG